VWFISCSFKHVFFYPLRSLKDFKIVHHYRNGGYENTAVTFFFGDSTKTLHLKSQESTQKLIGLLQYYNDAVADAFNSKDVETLLDFDIFFKYRKEQEQKHIESRGKRPLIKERLLQLGAGTALGIAIFFYADELNKAATKGTPLAQQPPNRQAISQTVPSQPQPTTVQRDSKTPSTNPVQQPVQPVVAQEEIEPVNPNTLRIGSAPLGRGVRSGYSTLTVENGTDTDALVRVIRFLRGEQLIRNFYIPANRTFTAEEIPPGNYVLRVAFGKDWNVPERRFNFRRSFSQTETFEISEFETEDVTTFSKMRITLHKVLHGNFHSQEISEEEFWR
jgi:hypothetical protein